MTPSKQQDLTSRTKSSLKWNTSLKILSQLFRFIVGVLLARLLDPIDFGIMAIGHMVIHYTNSLSDFGLINAIVQKKDLQPIHINSVFTLNLVISTALCLLVALFSSAIGDFFNSPESADVILFMSSLFVARTFRDIYMAILRRQILFKAIAIIVLIENISMSVIAILLACWGMSYWSLVWATILATLLAGTLFFFQLSDKPKIQYSHQAMSEIYNFGLWNFLRSQLFFINQFITQLIVGKLFGPIALGFFEKSHQLASTPRESISAQINAVMFSSFSRLQSDKEKLKEWFQEIVIMEIILVVPLLTGIIAVADQFIIVILGEKWAPSIPSLQILAVGVIFQILNGLIASLNVGIGQYKKQAFCEIPGTVLFLALCFPLAKWGINGIAMCYTVSMIFVSTTTFRLLQTFLPLSFIQFMKPILPYILINIAMIGIVRIVATAFGDNYSLFSFLSLVTAGGAFYLSSTIGVNISYKRKPLFPVKK